MPGGAWWQADPETATLAQALLGRENGKQEEGWEGSFRCPWHNLVPQASPNRFLLSFTGREVGPHPLIVPLLLQSEAK